MEQMEQMWQVCEIEDSCKPLLEKFSVSAVPEFWILKLEDGSLMCYWPKVNPGQKIRTRHVPQNGDKCCYYKCRLLMDGVKFSTYKEARAAEKAAQNFSSIMDCSLGTREVGTDQKLCDSTMHFDVSDADIEEENDITHSNNFDFDVSDIDFNVNKVTGNEFSKVVLKQGRYKKKSIIFKVEECDSDDNVANNPKAVLEDYNALFKLNNNFLTSTVIDESLLNNVQPSNDVISKFLTIASKMFFVLETIQKGVDDIIEVAKSASNKPKRKQDEEVISYPSKANVDYPVFEKVLSLDDNDSETNQKYEASNQDNAQFLDDYDEKKVVRVLNVEILNPPVQIDQDIGTSNETYVKEVSDNLTKINDTFVFTGETPNLTNGEVENISNKGTLNVKEDAMSESSNDPTEPETSNDPTEKNKTGEFIKMIKLPNNDVPGYALNEELLDYGSFYEEALIKHLQPYANEDETGYMNRTILTVFTQHFFLKHVSWKDEPDRVNMKRSTLLCCWKTSYESRFQPDDDNAKFIKHFRRFKSALRAKDKTKGNRITKVKKVLSGKIRK